MSMEYTTINAQRQNWGLLHDCDRVYYYRCERKIHKSLGKYKIARLDKFLFRDEGCTDIAYKISGWSQRIMKSGVYRLDVEGNLPTKEWAYIVCLDNGVRKEPTEETKIKYRYEP